MRLQDIAFGVFILLVLFWIFKNPTATNGLAITGIQGLNTTFKTLQGR